MSCAKFINTLANRSLLQNAVFRNGVTAVRSKSTEPNWVPKDPETHTGQVCLKNLLDLRRLFHNTYQNLFLAMGKG